MKKAATVVRYLFAVFYIFSALGYFFGFMPLPKMTGMAQQLIDAMIGSYLMTFVKLTELVGGILLLFNVVGPLSLAILAPITLNIFLFNLTLNPSELLVGLIMLLIHLGLTWHYRERFMLFFRK
ncbi:MAG: hypothetical protein WA131_11225 [Desulfitobacteriaceae bacterium]